MSAAAPVFISGIRHALGTRVSTVEESASAGRTLTPAAALRQAGFEQHWMCAPEETTGDIAHRIVAAMGDVSASGGLIHATCLPQSAALPAPRGADSRDVKTHMDFPVSHLQADFGLDNALLLGVNQQACTSLLGALRLARALLIAEPELGTLLCLSADRFPDGALYEQSYSLISDGGAGCTVSGDDGELRIVACHHIANGALAQAGDDETVGAYFGYTHRLVTELLERAGTSAADIDWIVPQNLNRRAWEVLARLLGIDPARLWSPTLAEVGHVISGDNLINLAALLESGRLRAGEHVLLVMGGYGMHWQALLLEKT
jgi:3-oxoacyl-[acyl-carrier-protein] synthase-3